MRRGKEKDLRRIMSRRGFMLAGAAVTMTGFLGARLYYLQVAQTSRYQRLSDRNQFNVRVVPPTRGRLFDHKMRLVAGNAESFELRVTPLYARNLQNTLNLLASIIELSETRKEYVMATAKTSPSFREITVRDDLSQRELARLAVRSALLPGVSFGKSLRRIYPQGALTCHITGYVSPVTQREIENDKTLEILPTLGTGKTGVEYMFERNLRGLPGREKIEVNATGRPIKVLSDVPPSSGGDVQLSVDIGVQLHASERLRQGRWERVKLGSHEVQSALASAEELQAHLAVGDDMILRDGNGRLVPAESGAAVVMDIHTGEVISLVSAPMFDPNLFTGKLLNRDWRRLNEHPRRPLLNRVTSGLYAPGSTFKMVVGLAALEAGVISENTEFFCKGDRELGDSIFHCWRKGGHGAMNIVSALEQSCDVYFYELALKTGIQKIRDMALRLGLGGITGVELPNEKRGIIPSHEWKLATKGAVWTPGETVVAGIGQGYVLTTPMQLAVMTARIANGKKAVVPSLLSKPNGASQDFAPLDISESALAVIRRGMSAVLYGGAGTANSQRLSKKYGGMAGKTGTVQVKRITLAQREKGIKKNIDRPWVDRDHALFVAYAPLRNPRFAISVVVEHGGSGSTTAAPVARDILAKTIAERGGI